MIIRRKPPTERRNDILAAAMPLAKAHGYVNVTRVMVAEAAGISPTLVQYHFGTMHALRDEIVLQALDTGEGAVVAQAIIAGHPAVLGLNSKERAEALAALA